MGKIQKIYIGADIVPTESNFHLFEDGKLLELVGEDLFDILQDNSFKIFNLEVPLTNEQSPIAKCGPTLVAPTKSIDAIKQIKNLFLTLANNHILDQGEQGLNSTINILNDNNISFAGVGKNKKESFKPYIQQFENFKLGVYCCAEHEFSIANENSAGANPFDPLESLDHISQLKKEVDYIIVLYHGGKEHYRYPSPNLQKVCRKLVEKGADLVICQHSHCIGCQESWEKGTIVYGQGNFIFDGSDSEYWQTSLLINLTLDSDLKTKIDYIPIEKKNNKIRLASDEKSKKILTDFFYRSKQILNEEFVENNFEEFAATSIQEYISRSQGNIHKGVLYRVINKLLRNSLRKHSQNKDFKTKNILALKNAIECEAHSELFISGLNELLKKDKI